MGFKVIRWIQSVANISETVGTLETSGVVFTLWHNNVKEDYNLVVGITHNFILSYIYKQQVIILFGE